MRRLPYLNLWRYLPHLDFVEFILSKIEDRVSTRVYMQRVAARGDQRRLRVIGIVVIAAATVALIGLEGHQRSLIAANSGLTDPERKAAPAQIEIGKLLPASPDSLARRCADPQPQPIH